jgi:hypothetical protein
VVELCSFERVSCKLERDEDLIGIRQCFLALHINISIPATSFLDHEKGIILMLNAVVVTCKRKGMIPPHSVYDLTSCLAFGIHLLLVFVLRWVLGWVLDPL